MPSDLTKEYVRKENNEWRVVAWDALRSTTGMVAQAKITNHTVPSFHYDPTIRKKIITKKRKNRFKKWKDKT